MKICSECKKNKPYDSFYKNNSGGYLCRCKECYREYYLTNEDYQKSTKNRSKEKYKNNKSECQEKMTKWRRANQDKCSSYCAKREAKKLQATPKWADTEFEKFVIQEMYSLAKLRSELTNVIHHVDHIVPLNSDIVQGFHCLANLQILEARINISKGNRSWPNMPQ